MDNLLYTLFRPALSSEQMQIALDTKEKNLIYCRYQDTKYQDEHDAYREHVGLYNRETCEILWSDNATTVRLKMLALGVIGHPILSTMRLGLQPVKGICRVAEIALKSIKLMIDDLSHYRFKTAIVDRIIVDLSAEIVFELGLRTIKTLRIIAYAFFQSLSCLIAAALSPHQGKRIYSLLETNLNHGFHIKETPKSLKEWLKLFFEKEILYVFPCPHPWAMLNKEIEANRYHIICYDQYKQNCEPTTKLSIEGTI